MRVRSGRSAEAIVDKAKNLGLVLLGLGVIAGVVLLFALFIEGAVWVTVKLTLAGFERAPRCELRK